MKNDKQVVREDFAAWWLSHDDITEALSPEHGDACGLPRYIRNELEDMQARPLRGRLWVPPVFEGAPDAFNVPEEAFMATPFTRTLARAGAVIVKREDVPALQHFSGHVTTLELERLAFGPTVFATAKKGVLIARPITARTDPRSPREPAANEKRPTGLAPKYWAVLREWHLGLRVAQRWADMTAAERDMVRQAAVQELAARKAYQGAMHACSQSVARAAMGLTKNTGRGKR